MADDQLLAAFLATVNVGDILTGTVAEVTRSQTTVLLDAFAGAPVGVIGSLDLSWRSFRRSTILQVGDRVSAEVIAVDPRSGTVRLSRSATENPQLWAFLTALRRGQRLTGTVAAVESFGIFVDLDEGPKHPSFPGVGFITMPELSWRSFEDPFEIVAVGQYVTCEVLAFDTSNGEARLSLRATQPDPFQQFARDTHVGQALHGTVTRLLPFGAVVRVAEGIEGLIHLSELPAAPLESPDQAVREGDEVAAIVTDIDLVRRRLALSRRRSGAGHNSRDGSGGFTPRS
ncbi:S1 RNA-binding domain-containing protein [Cryptosporangium aurantiacum]|uniref:Small subunit ribosomal protein S1 n=1 Tax=Cryptosporangium aurantiacum TaxID=134849 RepID=A0A1M7R1T7_9ACTN|nr:S1 RNA-binding domain-containing protein [Cryptosporangium aurantiacum]SHN38714.1 small subunit ribosomal protein S1 [Cryptosporangium aurantiacum]